MVAKETKNLANLLGLPPSKIETYETFKRIQYTMCDQQQENGGLEAFFSEEELKPYYEVSERLSANGHNNAAIEPQEYWRLPTYSRQNYK